MELEKLAVECLEELGGDRTPIRGAKLASYIARRARGLGLGDFHATLRSRGQTFKAFVHQLGLKVTDYQGRDLTVALQGASTDDSTVGFSFSKGDQIRKDVYDAFTRIEPNGYCYVPSIDRFRPIISIGAIEGVKVPALTIGDLLKVRNSFVDRLAQNSPDALVLRNAIDSPSALRRFTAALAAMGRTNEWRVFLFEYLQKTISDWATENAVTIREDWFRQPSLTKDSRGELPSHLGASSLRRWLGALSDEELGQVMIPAQIVEKLLRK